MNRESWNHFWDNLVRGFSPSVDLPPSPTLDRWRVRVVLFGGPLDGLEADVRPDAPAMDFPAIELIGFYAHRYRNDRTLGQWVYVSSRRVGE